MIIRGDCLCCNKIKTCTVTSVEKAKSGYTCPVFEPVSEPEWRARNTAMVQFGETIAIEAMMDRSSNENDEDEDGR